MIEPYEELLDWAINLLRAAKVRIGIEGYNRLVAHQESWAERVDMLTAEVGLVKLEKLANEVRQQDNG